MAEWITAEAGKLCYLSGDSSSRTVAPLPRLLQRCSSQNAPRVAYCGGKLRAWFYHNSTFAFPWAG